MDTIFKNSKNSKTSNLDRRAHNLTDKINLKINISSYQILVSTVHGKI